MTQQELDKIIERHQHWLKKDCEGWEDMKADLKGVNLKGVNLKVGSLVGDDLKGANLYGADLVGADLSGANLREANLRGEKQLLKIINDAFHGIFFPR